MRQLVEELVRNLEAAIGEAEGWYDDGYGCELRTDKILEAKAALTKGKEWLREVLCTTTK